MKSAKAKNKKVVIEECDKPLLHDKGAIIKVLGCGLCGSDIVKLQSGNENIILGHEVVGVIEEIVSDTMFKVGDIVAMGHHYSCGKCRFCRHGNVSMCNDFKKTNIFPGGFSEYIFVSEGHLKHTVFYAESDIHKASFLEPLACCIRAIKRAQLLSEDKCLVIGLGSIGLIMAQALKYYGMDVYGSDIISQRCKFAEKLSIKIAFENNSIDAVFMTSGSYKAITDALKAVRDGGKIIVFSSVKNEDGYTNNDVYYRELTVVGSYSPSVEDLKDSSKILKYISTEGILTEYPLEQLENAVNDTIENKIYKAFIKL